MLHDFHAKIKLIHHQCIGEINRFEKQIEGFLTLFNCVLVPLNTEFPHSLCAARHFCSVDGWTLQNLYNLISDYMYNPNIFGCDFDGLTKCWA